MGLIVHAMAWRIREDIVFQINEILNYQLLKRLRNQKLLIFLQRSAFDVWLNVNVYYSVILH